MSMTEHPSPVGTSGDISAPARHRGPMPRNDTPIVPRSSISGRALMAVVAIMTFLASLTTGAVMLVQATASDWQSDVSREVTIQIRPASGRDIETDIRRAAEVARSYPGVIDVRPFTHEESARLLEPWLGTGLALEGLPVPRLITVRLAAESAFDPAQLRKLLAAQVPGASLDDHRGWIERMRVVTGTAVAAGIVILLLVLAATVLSVTFATRGAMATNRPIVEVLHFIGAKPGFILGQFQRHFLVLGLKGGAVGGGAAILVFVLAELIAAMASGGSEVAALFGSLSLGVVGYAVVVAQVLMVALVTAWTSRHIVSRTLESIG